MRLTAELQETQSVMQANREHICRMTPDVGKGCLTGTLIDFRLCEAWPLVVRVELRGEYRHHCRV